MFLFFRCFFRFFIGIHAKAQRTEQIKEDIDAADHRTAAIECAQCLRHPSRQGDTPLLRGLGHFVSKAIHDDRRVIVILLDHRAQILPPPRVIMCRVIVSRFMDIPAIRQFVHDQHPHFIARLQHRPGARIMRRADGIEPRFFQQTDFAPLGVRVRARAQQAVVVVHAGAAQHGALPIDAQSVPGVTLYGANAETDLLLVLPETDTAKIALGRFRRPKFHIRQRI